VACRRLFHASPHLAAAGGAQNSGSIFASLQAATSSRNAVVCGDWREMFNAIAYHV